VGDLVFKKYGDEVVISRKPDMGSVVATPAQEATRERFKQATLYGKMVMADPDSKAVYEAAAKAKGQPVFSLTVADFFHAPSVDEVDLSGYSGAPGDVIRIRASDDFEVAAVQVSLADASGAILEEGAATMQNGLWLYNATTTVQPGTTVRLTVSASDRPGSVTTHQEETTI